LFPGVATLKRAFTVQYTEMTPQAATEIGGWVVHVYDVDHPSGAPSHALRLEGYGKVFAFTGDSQWCEAVVTAGRNADLYLMECYRFAGQPFMHLSWENILGSLDRIGARRVLLTHMSADMLAQQGAIHDPRITFADDGLVVTI
jgi:ribonuclease BN (tRNA processing enzyme)